MLNYNFCKEKVKSITQRRKAVKTQRRLEMNLIFIEKYSIMLSFSLRLSAFARDYFSLCDFAGEKKSALREALC